jgi:hypothetical protein
MAWLRIDDGFTKHPKFEGWSRSDRWAWLEVMEYCARYRTRGRIPAELDLLPRAVTTALLKRAEQSGWCTRREDGALWINDWDAYNPPAPEQLDELVAAAFQATPEASANDVYKTIGGSRNLVLAAIKRYRTGTAVVPDQYAEVVSRGQARASRPVPRETVPPSLSSLELEPQLSEPLGSAGGSAGSPANGRAPDPDEWFEPADDQPKRKGKATPVAGDKARPYNRELAEAFVRNSAMHDPHPKDALLAQYADIPSDDLVELTDLAFDLAREHEGATT